MASTALPRARRVANASTAWTQAALSESLVLAPKYVEEKSSEIVEAKTRRQQHHRIKPQCLKSLNVALADESLMPPTLGRHSEGVLLALAETRVKAEVVEESADIDVAKTRLQRRIERQHSNRIAVVSSVTAETVEVSEGAVLPTPADDCEKTSQKLDFQPPTQTPLVEQIDAVPACERDALLVAVGGGGLTIASADNARFAALESAHAEALAAAEAKIASLVEQHHHSGLSAVSVENDRAASAAAPTVVPAQLQPSVAALLRAMSDEERAATLFDAGVDVAVSLSVNGGHGASRSSSSRCVFNLIIWYD